MAKVVPFAVMFDFLPLFPTVAVKTTFLCNEALLNHPTGKTLYPDKVEVQVQDSLEMQVVGSNAPCSRLLLGAKQNRLLGYEVEEWG